MAIPSTAVECEGPLDPHEELDFVFPCGALLELADSEEVASYTLTLLPEAVALGLEIMTGSGRDHALLAGNTDIEFWLTVDPLFQEDAAFDGAGAQLPLEVEIVTNATPARTRQRTALVRVVQQ